MRVLLASSSSGSRGGGEIFLLYLAEALRQAGHEPALWCAAHPRMDELAERFVSFGQVHRDPCPNSYLDRPTRALGASFDLPLAKHISRRWRELKPDVIHLNKQTLEDGLDLLGAARRSGLPAIATVHITQSNRMLGAAVAGIRDWLSRRALRKAGTIPLTAVSDLRGAELAAFTGRPAETIYNAVSDFTVNDREAVRTRLLTEHGWPADSLLVVCVARLVPQKDPMRFLRLAVKLHARDSRWRFLWIGDGGLLDEFERGSAALGIGSEVACTGWLPEPRKFLAAADLYLHPAAYEGLPLAILEAMCAGLPCVISPAIAAEADVFNSSSVIVCDEADDSWLERAADPASRETYGQASRRLYEEHFRPEVMAEKFIRLYRQTAASRP